MPAGSLKESATGCGTGGVPSRAKSTRNMVYASVAVPTVERELPPILFWSTTIAAERLVSESASGWP